MSWAARALHWCIQRVFPWPRGLGNLLNVHRDRDRLLQLLILNEEFLVNADHQSALITSLPFVHTARRTYRLDDPVKAREYDFYLDWWNLCKLVWTLSFRGRWSRNKVSVGEPAEGSLPHRSKISQFVKQWLIAGWMYQNLLVKMPTICKPKVLERKGSTSFMGWGG